jgi:3-deoxy-D-manno-octulosonic-acid transferase
MTLTARQRVVLWSYQAGLHLLLPLGLVLGLPWWLTSQKRRRTLPGRLGFQHIGLPSNGPRPLWVHALSLGETLSCVTLVRELRLRLAKRPLVFSVSTLAAREIAQQRLGGLVDRIFYFPLDLIPCVARVLTQVRPAAVVVVETDIWAGFLHALRRRGVPAFLVNARLSPRSFRSCQRWSDLFAPALNVFTRVFPQSDGEASRYRAVGVLPEKIGEAGNLKFDAAAVRFGTDDLRKLASQCGIGIGDRVWLAGSTHPGEEATILEVYRRLRAEYQGLRLVLVPRHPRRGPEVQALCDSAGLTGKLCSTGAAEAHEVSIVDAMGKLAALYQLAEVAFVGGSLVQQGGQNPIEPAAMAKPVVFGPDMSDFPDVAAELLERKAAVQVRDLEQLHEGMRQLLADPESAREMGARGEKWVESHRGTTARLADQITRRMIQQDRKHR